ncbi:MAG: VanZ family protein [Bacteroidales bacterium]
MMNPVHHYRFFLLPLAWTLIILVLSLLPPSAAPGSFLFNIPYGDKLLHFLFYLFLAVFWLLAFAGKVNKSNSLFRFAILLACIVFGGIIEIIQGFTAFRSMDAFDWLADAAGSSLALLCFDRVRKMKVQLVNKIKCLSAVFPS